MTYQTKVLFAVDNPNFLKNTVPILKRIEVQYSVLNPARQVCSLALSASDLILLETGDDAAKLVQIVYELYRNADASGFAPSIIGIASTQTIEQNPSLAFWLIDGHAALSCLWTPEQATYEHLSSIIRHMRMSDE